MLNNKMKNKIIYKNIQEDVLKRFSKVHKKKEQNFFFTPQISGYSLIRQIEGTKKILNKEKPKKEKKLSNITNYERKKLKKTKSKKINKSIISVFNRNKKNIFNNEITNKTCFQIQNYNIKSTNKNIIKHNKNINSMNITKFISDKNNNKNGNKIKLKNNNNNPFSEKLKNNKLIYNNILKNEINKKSSSIFDLEKKNIGGRNITYNRNKNNYSIVNTESDLTKIMKINERLESIYKKENNINNINCILNQIKRNVNMNNSSKLTNISSHASNLNSKQKPIQLINKSNDNINKLKKIFLLKLKIDSNESEEQEYESQFLNYDLGLSDEITSSKNNYLDEKLFLSNKNKIVNECEKPVEEIEKLANEIYNSQYKPKKMSYIYALKQNLDINDNTEELKEGEEIKNILLFNVNKKNK